MFYEFNQNNSGGHFVVDDKLCHRLFIEADNECEAINKAEELGCYWYGVSEGRDCSCCGDRWNKDWLRPVDMDKYMTAGYRVNVYDGIYTNTMERWNEKYGKYEFAEAPHWEKHDWGTKEYVGAIKFNNIEEYAQFLADEYGWTTPDIRIYYEDGTVKEIFKTETKEEVMHND